MAKPDHSSVDVVEDDRTLCSDTSFDVVLRTKLLSLRRRCCFPSINPILTLNTIGLDCKS